MDPAASRMSLQPGDGPSGTGTTAALHCGTPGPVRFLHRSAGSSSLIPKRTRASPPSCVLASVLTLRKNWRNVSTKSPHGTPGPEPRHATAHPKRSVGLNFSIGGRAAGSRDAPLIGRWRKVTDEGAAENAFLEGTGPL